MAYLKPRNNSYIYWIVSFLWLSSIISTIWSLILFLFFDNLILVSETDLICACVMLSGLLLILTNSKLLCYFSKGENVNNATTIFCFPLWVCTSWIMIVSGIGAVLCGMKIWNCYNIVMKTVSSSMRNYRSVPKYKRFIDSIQWSLRCCGLNSYKDWFTCDWYDKIRDYEWDPLNRSRRSDSEENDSVPLSCCKSGSCISNYLKELGTNSINTRGCLVITHRLILQYLVFHLILFSVQILAQVLTLNLLNKSAKASSKSDNDSNYGNTKHNVRHIMSARNNFHTSSGSVLLDAENNQDTSDEEIDDVDE